MTAGEELLLRIGRAAVEVDRLRVRQAAAKRARNKIQCVQECNVSGGGRVFVEPCWKRWEPVPPYGEDVERLDLESQCKECQRRFIRQQAFAAVSKRLAGARRRVTILARGYRTKGGSTR